MEGCFCHHSYESDESWNNRASGGFVVKAIYLGACVGVPQTIGNPLTLRTVGFLLIERCLRSSRSRANDADAGTKSIQRPCTRTKTSALATNESHTATAPA